MNTSSSPRIVIRCDGGTEIGMGHIIRCMALADMLRNDFQICFAIQETAERVYEIIRSERFEFVILPRTKNYSEDLDNLKKLIRPSDIVVLDGYNFKTDYQRGIKELGNKLVAIDDLHDWHHVADVVINHAGGVKKEFYSSELETIFCLGYDYRLLRREFLKLQKDQKMKFAIRNVLISMGAADLQNNTEKFAKACLEVDTDIGIDLLVSQLNPHLSQISQLKLDHPNQIRIHLDVSARDLFMMLDRTDLVIAPASTISLESCAVGVGLLTGITASNQNDNYYGLLEAQVCFGLGDLNLITLNKIIEKVVELKYNLDRLNFQIKNQSIIFGHDPKVNYIKIFKSLIV